MDNVNTPNTNATPAPQAASMLGGDSTPLYAQQVPSNQIPAGPPEQDTPAPQINDAGPNPLPSLPGVVPAEPVSAHRNLAAKILGALGDILGGKTNDQYSYDANGKLVTTKVQKTRGQQIATIAGNAMRGEAAGLAYRGPGAKAHSIGAGATAVMDQQQQDDQLKRTNAREDSETSNRVMLAKAQTAHITQETARSTWELAQSKAKFTSESMNAVSQLQAQIEGDPRSVDYGTYDNYNDFIAKHPDQVGAAKGMTSTTRAVPEFDKDGNLKLHVFSVAPDWASQKVDHDTEVPVFGGYELGKDGKPDMGKPKFSTQTVKAGTMTNEQFYNFSNAQFTKQADVVRQKQQDEDKHNLEKAQTNNLNSETAHRGDTEQKALQSAAIAGGYAEPVVNANGQVTGVKPIDSKDVNYGVPKKEMIKRQDEFSKSVYEKNVPSVEKSTKMFDDAYAEHQKGTKTGAQGMLALSTHLQTTFGNVKGARVTKDMIHEHLGARSVSDDALAAVQKLTNGDPLTNNQWGAFHDLIHQSRVGTWQNTIDSAKSNGVDVTRFLPKGAGKAFDHTNSGALETQSIYLYAFDGDAQKAAAAMQQNGWK